MTHEPRPRGVGAGQLAIGITVVNMVLFGAAWLDPRAVHAPPSLAGLGALLVAYVVVGSTPMRLYFTQHRAAFSLTDAVIVAGLFSTTPGWLGLIACAGEVLYCLPRRSSPVKAAFNASTHAATAVAAGYVFLLLGGHGRPGPASWLPALAAAACASLLNALAMSAVISRAEGARIERTLMGSMPTAILMTVLAAPVGLLVVELLQAGPLYLLLLVPVAAGISFNSRYAALQRDEHLRVERLYETTSRGAEISENLDVVSTIAEDARLLVTGSASICIVREGQRSPWSGRAARPGGVGDARGADVQHILRTAQRWEGTTLVLPVPDELRGLAPTADVMIVARSPEGAAVELVLAVFRERSGGRRVETGVGETLAAFAAHGAVMAANASLVGKLQQALRSQLAANQRKDEFVATISHELRTPLTVMLGAAQTLTRLQDRLGAPDRERLLQTAVDQGQRLKLLIEDLLLVASVEQDDRQGCQLLPVVTGQLAEDLRQDIPHTAKNRVRIDNRVPGVEVLTERFKVRQVLGNLVQNALKYAPGSEVSIVFQAAGEAVTVAVVDHGPGVREADRERVFERFLQLDQSSTRSQGGAGLGLYICRKLAKQLDATLELGETPGGGCTFLLRLPRRPLRRAAEAAESTAISRAPVAAAGMLRRPLVVPIGGLGQDQAKELLA